MNEPKSPISRATPAFFTVEQLATRWVVSVSTIKRRVANPDDPLKPIRLGPRTIRFAASLIEDLESR